ncbi:hypothetical protein [Peribacillus sp. Hz7]|uniref:hypothetical protein n=1 Tax=Peribacillus sp. Hz7 TaxID=3344873 RepID=UPI0035CB4CBA
MKELTYSLRKNIFDNYKSFCETELDSIRKNIDFKTLEKEIVTDIYNAIISREADPKRLQLTSENQFSDDIRDILQGKFKEYNIIVGREQPSGFAKKTIGEPDITMHTYLKNIYTSICVGEIKEWGKFRKQVKQLLGYMKPSTKFGFTIILNRKSNFPDIYNKIDEILQSFGVKKGEIDYFKTIEILTIKEMKNLIISKHVNPDDSSSLTIYHFIANANPNSGANEEAAIQARV